MKSPLFGLIEILVPWVAIAVTMVLYLRLSKPAGTLLVPYLLWVSFAALLNFDLAAEPLTGS